MATFIFAALMVLPCGPDALHYVWVHVMPLIDIKE